MTWSRASTSGTAKSAMQVLRPCRLLGGLSLPPCHSLDLFVRLWQGASRETPLSRTSTSHATTSAVQVLRPCRLLGGLSLPPCHSLDFFVRLWQGASRKTPRSRASTSGATESASATKSAMQVLRPCRLLGGLALPPCHAALFSCLSGFGRVPQGKLHGHTHQPGGQQNRLRRC